MSGEEYSLENLAREYKGVLIDSSALIGLIGQKKLTWKEEFNFTVRKINKITETYMLTKVSDMVEDGSLIYVTEGVLEEVVGDSDICVRRNKWRRVVLKFLKKSQGKQRRFFQTMSEQEKVLDFSERENPLYERFATKYGFLKKRYCLTEVDFDFLISGLTFCFNKNPFALVSNDFGIYGAFLDLKVRERIPSELLRFFNRTGKNIFERPKFKKDWVRSVN